MIKAVSKKTYDIQDLHSDLQEYWCEEYEELQHPLVRVSRWDLDKANRLFEYKCAEIHKAIDARNWNTYIALYERTYRVDVLWDLRNQYNLRPEEWWPLVGWVWCDTENARQDRRKWRSIWLSRRPHRHLAMSEEERDRLDSLPSELIIWRGASDRKAVRGFSWTLNRDVANRFGRRFVENATPYFVACGRLRKADIIAYFNCRSEEEIVAVPQSIAGIEVQQLWKK